MQRLVTPFTEAFGCRVPILGAPMAGVSGGSLAAATTRAGALGFIAAGHLADTAALRRQVELFRAEVGRPDAPLALGFLSYSSMKGGDLSRVEEALEEHRPAVVQFFAPALLPAVDGEGVGANVRLAQRLGAKVIAQVGSVKEAREALACGVDCVIAQGREAGGHGLRTELASGTLPLAARVAALASEAAAVDGRRTPVLAAGGIMDGKGLAAVLALGCDGAVLGTRLWACEEGIGNPRLQARLVEAEADDVVRTMAFSVGAVRNETSERWHGKESGPEGLDEALRSARLQVAEDYKRAVAEGDANVAGVLSGEGVGEVTSIRKAEEVVRSVELEAMQEIQRLQGLIRA